MSLHDELSRLADTAPRPGIDHSVWDRGRALRRRDRLVTSAVALVTVLVLGGLVVVLTGPPRALEPAGTTVPDGAVPSRIEGVPDRVTGPLETDLAIGTGSAAFISGNGLPVVITATDGHHHLLDLPGWSNETDALALSPRGDRLAWQTHEGAGARATVLGLLDLVTGDVVGVQVDERPDVDVRAVAWSPDSGRIGMIGERPTAPRTIVGRVDVETRTGSVLTEDQDTLTGLAVSNEGVVAVGRADGSMTAVLPDGAERQFPVDVTGGGAPGAFSSSSDWLALTTPSGDASLSLHLVGGGGLAEHPFPDGTFGDAGVLPVGWLDDRLQLLLVRAGDSDGELVITTPEVNVTSTWRRGIGSVDPAAAASLTVAVDLLPEPDGSSMQAFTHDFPEPDWPMSGAVLSLLIGLGVAAAWSLLLVLRWLWRRRTRLR